MFEFFSGALRAPYRFLMIFFLRSLRSSLRSGFEWFLHRHRKKRSKIFRRSPSARGFETAQLFNFFAGCKTWVDFHTGCVLTAPCNANPRVGVSLPPRFPGSSLRTRRVASADRRGPPALWVEQCMRFRVVTHPEPSSGALPLGPASPWDGQRRAAGWQRRETSIGSYQMKESLSREGPAALSTGRSTRVGHRHPTWSQVTIKLVTSGRTAELSKTSHCGVPASAARRRVPAAR